MAWRTARSSFPAPNLSIIYPNGKPAFNPANADEVNWTGEIALDVESAHAIAPAAKIDLVIAGSTYIRSASLPAADPLVTGVGATSLTASQPAGGYKSETAWNDTYGASGGGYSKLFARPSYQNGFVPSGGRGVPDVSCSGDVNNGLLIAWSQGVTANVGNIYEFGGSSAASPQWAAIIALADQAGHRRLGFLNGDLYSLAHGSRYGYVFHDITRGNNTVSLAGSNNETVRITGYSSGKGWDLGTPNVAHLIQYLH